MSHLQLRAADGHTFSARLSRPAGRAFPQGEYHTCPAGHGCNCTDRASFDAAAAHAAFGHTPAFPGKDLG